MNKRPTSITVISWILIVTAVGNLIMTTALVNNPTVLNTMGKSPIPIAFQYVMSYLGLVISAVSGIAMLKRCNWARFLYVIWGSIGAFIGILTSPNKAGMFAGLVVFVVFVFFLFNRKANTFFVSTKEPSMQ